MCLVGDAGNKPVSTIDFEAARLAIADYESAVSRMVMQREEFEAALSRYVEKKAVYDAAFRKVSETREKLTAMGFNPPETDRSFDDLSASR